MNRDLTTDTRPTCSPGSRCSRHSVEAGPVYDRSEPPVLHHSAAECSGHAVSGGPGSGGQPEEGVHCVPIVLCQTHFTEKRGRVSSVCSLDLYLDTYSSSSNTGWR